MIRSFQTKSIDEKIAKFFQFIDEDGNGCLSFDELVQLAKKSFLSLKDMEKSESDGEFYDQLSEYFAHFIFKKANVDPSDEISLDALHEIVSTDEDGAHLLEMFCGEQLMDLE